MAGISRHGGQRQGDIGCTDDRHTAATHEVEVFVVPAALVLVHDGIGLRRSRDVGARQMIAAADGIASSLIGYVAEIAGVVMCMILRTQTRKYGTRKLAAIVRSLHVPSNKSLYLKLDATDFDPHKKTAIYKFTNDLSHFTGKGFDPALVAETQKNVAYLLELIKDVAPLHYAGLKALAEG